MLHSTTTNLTHTYSTCFTQPHSMRVLIKTLGVELTTKTNEPWKEPDPTKPKSKTPHTHTHTHTHCRRYIPPTHQLPRITHTHATKAAEQHPPHPHTHTHTLPRIHPTHTHTAADTSLTHTHCRGYISHT